MITRLKEQWLGVLAVVIIVVLGVVLGAIGGQWGLWGMLSALGLGILVVVSSFFVYWYTHTEGVLKEVRQQTEATLQELRKQVLIFHDIYLFLITDDALKEIERKADEVWIMTPNLYYERVDPSWKTVVFENAEREIPYIYFIEKALEGEFNQHMADIQRFLMTKGKTIGDRQIVAKIVDIVIPTEVVFYNPSSDMPEGFVVTPVEGAKTNMRMDPQVSNRVLALLKQEAKR